MAVPSNILQQVQTYQKAELAWMLNSFFGIATSNKKFKDFNKLKANLGDTVTFDLAPRSSTGKGLVVSTQQSVQRLQSLSCSQAAYSASAFTDQQFIFNVEDYMDRFGKSRSQELGTQVEIDILKNFNSSVTIDDPQNPNFGLANDVASGPYRYYDANGTNIDSFEKLAQGLANFRDYGASPVDTCGVIPLIAEPGIVGTGLQKFALDRNNDIAESWMIGDFGQCDWYRSNLLPIQFAGTVGKAGVTLTLVTSNDPTGNNITSLTFSGAPANDPNAFKNGDLFQFIDVSGLPNIRYRTFQGHAPSSQRVQCRVVGDTASNSSGNVTVNIYPALQSTSGINQNLSVGLQPGMKVTSLADHRCGLIWSGHPLYLAMPELPDEDPYKTVTTMDPESGCSIRHYWGSQFGQNTRSYVWDVIWGSTLVAENCMRLIFPV